jgi:hypothetical protein
MNSDTHAYLATFERWLRGAAADSDKDHKLKALVDVRKRKGRDGEE